mmetsp:Transcript_8958/g.21877  ORF Transcript_8958/g.21877 Transcript_8958/m.21877 type:complete len:100 (-) Transcript_8958:1106-1405(-)
MDLLYMSGGQMYTNVDPSAAPVNPTTNETSSTVQDIAVTSVKIPATSKKLFLSSPIASLPKLDASPIIASRAPQTTKGKPKRIEKPVASLPKVASKSLG